MRTPLELAKLHGCLRIHLVRVDDRKHTLCALRVHPMFAAPAERIPAGRHWPWRPRGQAYRLTGAVSACTCLRCHASLRNGYQIPRLWRQSDPQYRRQL